MSEQRPQVRIYAAFSVKDIMTYIDSHAGVTSVDVDATLTACERGIEAALATVHPEARIVVRRQDKHATEPPRTRVETDDPTVDPELIGQEIDDLIAEFDIISCVVYQR